MLITAPGAEARAAEAADQLDANLRLNEKLLHPEDEAPGWFRAVKKTGYWWFLICVAIALPIVLLVGSGGVGQRIAIGLTVGLGLGFVSSAVLGSIGNYQARRTIRAKAHATVQELAAIARTAPARAEETAAAVIGADARLESQVHDLLWRSALPDTADGHAARADLDALTARVAPETASRQKTADEELEAKLAQVRKDNGL
ncbi:hypothetical protein [Promicromonospora aerolata]|uniref:Uncharacterized protein n=1 Tax=Promicromonospora aerolata TaxID=195749 RepID=A0ABW4V8Q9_9MICO